MNLSLVDQDTLSKKLIIIFYSVVYQYHSIIRTEQQQQCQSPGQEAAWHMYLEIKCTGEAPLRFKPLVT